MKISIGILLLMTAAGSANAQCFGSGSYYSCSDSSGNHYNVQKFGNMTQVQGSNANGSWSSTSQRFGNTTFQNGTSIDGGTWNQTIQSNPGGGTMRYGTDSDGDSFYSYE